MENKAEFMDSLISVSQIGRSLGIHLILATQKPAGVIDEKIRGNSRFRIALRLVDRSDSTDLIGRCDAAAIRECGRAYLQVGNDEEFVLFQSAYAMGKASGSERIRVYEDPFLKKEITGRRDVCEDLPTWFDLMMSALVSADKDADIRKPLPLWLPELPDEIEDAFEELLVTNLKKNDIINRYSGSFFAIITDCDPKNYNAIIKRIEDKWKENGTNAKYQILAETEAVE